MLRIDYDPALVPKGGAEVVSECASPLSGCMTAEPAGRKFHEKCLKVRGLYGAFRCFKASKTLDGWPVLFFSRFFFIYDMHLIHTVAAARVLCTNDV